jgi:hypothetical protein
MEEKKEKEVVVVLDSKIGKERRRRWKREGERKKIEMRPIIA